MAITVGFPRVIVDVASNFVEKKIFIDKNASGDLKHKVVE